MLSERQKKILDLITEEYIDSAEPVSSSFLVEKYGFNLCSATMRIEMKNLTEGGFLEKAHISAGRIPTDKAYRFLVDNLIGKKIYTTKIGKMMEELELIEDEYRLASIITDKLANLSSNYIIFSYPAKKIFWQSGFEDLIKAPEFSKQEFVLSFLSSIDDFKKVYDEIEIGKEINIYIGEENPFFNFHDLSLILSEHKLKNNETFRLSLIGPKRMDYNNNIRLINSLIKTLDETI